MSDGSMFAGDHGPDNAWRSEKGSMLAPHLQMPLEGHNSGDPRFNGEVNSQNWETSLIQSGAYDPNNMTRAGGTLAK